MNSVFQVRNNWPMTTTLVFGVAGGSGSGKTTFTRMLQAHLGENFCGLLHQDNYYRDLHEQFDFDGGAVNFDHPNSVEMELLVNHILRLKSGHPIDVPTYDFTTHCRRENKIKFLCRPVIIVDGILLLAHKPLRDLFDFTIFVETQEDLRFQRRLERDVRERGRTREGVHEQFHRHVKPMHDLFVEPSKRFAKKIISGEKSFGPVIEELIYGLNFRAASREPAQSSFGTL